MNMDQIKRYEEIGKGEHNFTEVFDKMREDYDKIEEKYHVVASCIFNGVHKEDNKKVIPGGYHPESVMERLKETPWPERECVLKSVMNEYKSLLDKLILDEEIPEELFD